jgi:inhibitor of KinA
VSETRVVAVGDSALALECAERIDPEINALVLGAADAVRRAALPGVRDVVPAFRSLTVYFDPLKTDVTALARLLSASSRMINRSQLERKPPIRIPVHYGGADGPDLEDVARLSGLRASEVVEIHCARTYRVFMLGFLPGFAYLAPVDERLVAPRLSAPRVRVPAGSVGIAGSQTGIYPSDSPGGWRIVGRTSIRPFDPAREQPSLLRPGDLVEFFPQ